MLLNCSTELTFSCFDPEVFDPAAPLWVLESGVGVEDSAFDTADPVSAKLALMRTC